MDTNKNALPWDVLKNSTKYVSEKVYSERYEICKACEFFNRSTQTCKVCHCFMKLKCKMQHAFCPKDKWGVDDTENDTSTKKQGDGL